MNAISSDNFGYLSFTDNINVNGVQLTKPGNYKLQLVDEDGEVVQTPINKDFGIIINGDCKTIQASNCTIECDTATNIHCSNAKIKIESRVKGNIHGSNLTIACKNVGGSIHGSNVTINKV
jgi:hypothetical protein